MEQDLKCRACSYEYMSEWDAKPIKGDEEFIQIRDKVGFEIVNPKEMEAHDYTYNPTVGVDLYACPKCNTVQMVLKNEW